MGLSDGFFHADLPADVSPGDQITIVGPEAHHVGVVRRTRRGELVTLTDGLGRGVVAQLTEASKTQIDFKVESVLVGDEPQPWLAVVQAIPKPDRALLAIDLMTEAGVDEIIGWTASRCQVEWAPQQVEKARAKWITTAREASKQARRLRFPVVSSLADTEQVVGMVTGADLAIVMHEKATVSIAEAVVPDKGRVLIVIGPEGGLTEDEVSRFVQAGGRAFSMGPTVLRTSTAAALAVTQVRLLAELTARRLP